MDRSWKQRFQPEDEDEALAKALSRSLEDDQDDGSTPSKSQKDKRHREDSRQPSHRNMVTNK